MRPSGIEALEVELQAEGYRRGTPAFESALLQRRVERCQEVKNVTSCRACTVFDHCETAKDFLVQLRYNPVPQAKQELIVQDRLPDWVFPPETKAAVADENGTDATPPTGNTQ